MDMQKVSHQHDLVDRALLAKLPATIVVPENRPVKVVVPAAAYANVVIIGLMSFAAKAQGSLFWIATVAFYTIFLIALGLAGLYLIQVAFHVQYKRRAKTYRKVLGFGEDKSSRHLMIGLYVFGLLAEVSALATVYLTAR